MESYDPLKESGMATSILDKLSTLNPRTFKCVRIGENIFGFYDRFGIQSEDGRRPVIIQPDSGDKFYLGGGRKGVSGIRSLMVRT
jgi:hypothetical protein